MPGIAVECVIDNHPWFREQLATVEYDRHTHVLHEMERLGAALEYAGKPLTHDEINFLLDAAEARNACIAARQSYGIDGITDLYQDLLAGGPGFRAEAC